MEQNSLLNELMQDGLSIRLEKAQLYLINEIQNRVEQQLQGGLNKKEFAQWFANTIAELKQQVSRFPTWKQW